MGRISDAQLDLIRQRADIVAMIGERVALEKKGRDFAGRCPFHEEKTPSFYVNPQKQAWFCHGSCKKGGDIFGFVRDYEKLGFVDAVRLVARRVGVELEDETPEQRARARRKADLLDGLNRTVDFYKRCLSGKSPAAEAARAFLAKRGVSDETAEAFSLGVAPHGSALIQKASGVPGMLPILRELGLVREGREGPRDFFSNRLLFPIADESGRWIAFGARRLDEEDQPKFLNSRDVPGIFEKKRVLYGLDRARNARPRAQRLIVVEGYMDVVIAHQAGVTNVVGALSTGFTREHSALAKRFVDGVTILFDGDVAGQTANRRVLEELLELDLDARVATLPDGFDPDDLILKQGKEAFEKLATEGSRDLFQYLVDVTVGPAGEGRVTPAIVSECARLLGKFRDDIRHQLSLRHVAERLRFPEDMLRKEALRSREAARLQAGRRSPASPAEQMREAVLLEHADPQVRLILGDHACAGEAFEVLLLEALLARPEAARHAAAAIETGDFTRGPLRELAATVLGLARDEATQLGGVESADERFMSQVLQALGDRGAASGIAARLLARIHEHPEKRYEAELEGARTLVRRRQKARILALQHELEQASARGDVAAVDRILAEKAALERAAAAPITAEPAHAPGTPAPRSLRAPEVPTVPR